MGKIVIGKLTARKYIINEHKTRTITAQDREFWSFQPCHAAALGTRNDRLGP